MSLCNPNKRDDSKATSAVIIIVSIVISALIVRAIYTFFEYLKLVSDECINGVEDGEELISGFIRTMLVIAICVFLIIVIYMYMKSRYH